MAALLAMPLSATATTLPPGFVETIVASGLQHPTAMALAPDGRIFVCQQEGQLRVVSNGSLLVTPFVTVPTTADGERGLLGVAFDPAFAVNQYVYVYYTATTPTVHNRVSRFTASGDVALAGSEFVVVDLDPLSTATNHNGGAIHFASDGKLYIAVGDNADGTNSQTLANRFGKMLRINSDGTIPSDNPFYSTASGANGAIWALGLRNPFTFGVQRGTTTLLIDDVGESSWEEIDRGMAGANYGWPITEGPTTDPRFTSPLYAYDHSNGCAITGGAFYDPVTVRFPSEYVGTYFFADLCGGWIERLAIDTGIVTTFATGITSPVDLTVSADGSLYYLARGSGVTTGVVGRIDAFRAPSVTVTANGSAGPIALAPWNTLAIALAFDAGSASTLSPAEMYFGVITGTGVLWLDPATHRFSPTPQPVVSGSLPSFAPVTLFQFVAGLALEPGTYVWFAVVDPDTNGVPNGPMFDAVLTIVL